MDTAVLLKLLQQVRQGRVTPTQALDLLKDLPYQDLGFAKLDHHRVLRKGFPEVVLGKGKSPEQLAAIATALAKKGGPFLISRADPAAFRAVKKAVRDARYHRDARAIVYAPRATKPKRPGIVVITGGTSDIPVAEEAALIAELMGNEVEKVYDVGAAGVHRLLDHLAALRSARVIVAVAGMDGVLPTLVSGLVKAPVIGVPVSNGYGASFGGVSALLTMLNSCSLGIAVVNIDNGLGAGFIAALINREASPFG
ncbi:MAG: nickel pincer cofactor biosynthesis protein LarB [Chloroflexi bacterium]|nr:nickel pincer cofactor biosynthesis protein LarB [Chloroflexota bacterium]